MGCTAQQIGNPDWGADPFTNPLVEAESPFLQRHGHDPVEWREWRAETLEEAQRSGKPLLVAVGFSASYWCQRMQQRCYRDTVVADLMNRAYIPVLIDREVRPDLDARFLALCNQVQGQGCGWPLHVILTPEGTPVHVETFLERQPWLDLLTRFDYLFRSRPAEIERLAEALRIQPDPSTAEDLRATAELSDLTMTRIQRQMDLRHGGIQGSPKFLRGDVLALLLQDAALRQDATSRSLVLLTLDRMADGAIYDQLGGGFFRLSTNFTWQRPQFEKMLYDQALMVTAYARGFQLTGRPRYEQVIYETLQWVDQGLLGQAGGYQASLAADSEGELGRYYLWPRIELDGVLGADAKIFAQYYNITDEGNWAYGQNIPYRSLPDSAWATLSNISLPEFQDRISEMRGRMHRARQRRLLPRHDGKQITAWNALMTSAWAVAYQALGDPDLLAHAIEGGEYLIRNCRQPEGKLFRYLLQDTGYGAGFLSDYAYTARALLDLYQLTLDKRWVYQAQEVATYAITHFYDASRQRFTFTEAAHWLGPLGPAPWPPAGALPNPAVVMGDVLVELDELLGKPLFREAGLAVLRGALPAIAADPLAEASGSSWLQRHTHPQLRLLLPPTLPSGEWQRFHRSYLPNLLGIHSDLATDWWQRHGQVPPRSGWWRCQGVDCDSFPSATELLIDLQAGSK
jgi:hypothetical protein